MRGKVAAPFFFPLPHLLPAGWVGRTKKKPVCLHQCAELDIHNFIFNIKLNNLRRKAP
jgi:hypothetical protein